jgi:hypothetical protein
MYILDYRGKQVGVVIGGSYIYEFASHENAKEKIDLADKFLVLFPRGWQDFPGLRKQDLKVKDDGTKYEDL